MLKNYNQSPIKDRINSKFDKRTSNINLQDSNQPEKSRFCKTLTWNIEEYKENIELKNSLSCTA